MKLEYIIPHRGNSLGKIFGVMEINKLNYFISDYSVSQTTLDQVTFISIETHTLMLE